ncbi:MAG: LptA/OstA family protein [Rhodospirillaceae bacterium]|nr:LptA/OstA family protein [Rhodospirillaceae bacterium]
MTATLRTAMALAMLMCAAHRAHGQSLTFAAQESDQPIEVTADGGIEWQQNKKLFIARGNARAVQGEVSVTADELVAHYRETDGETQVYRVDAQGSVKIASAEETATGAAAVYDFDKAVLVVEGAPVTLTNADGAVTANGTLQYWSEERVAVAEGDAQARDRTRSIRADKLVAYFAPPADGAHNGDGPLKRGRFTLVRGEGNVRLTTDKETAVGDRGEYNLENGIAKLEGSVKITRENNQLNGGFAIVDTNAGTSRLFGSAREAGVAAPGVEARVKALLAPAPQATPSAVPGGR